MVVDYDVKGDSTSTAVSYPRLPHTVKVGGAILIADGSLSVEVTEIGADLVLTEVKNNCKIGERKNMNRPG